MRNFLSLLISVIPNNFLKKFFFKLFLKICIDKESKIGFFVFFTCNNVDIVNSTIGNFILFDVENLRIDNSVIKNFNIFKNISKVNILKSSISRKNKFVANFLNKIKDNSITINNSFVGKKNLLDISDCILIEDSLLQDNIQIWTHSFDRFRKIKYGKVTISNGCFISFNIIILPNVTISNYAEVLPGTIIHKHILESGIYSSVMITKDV
jgi:acetyltransferase-like isoleucine patch superfamily enzyme